MFSFNDWEEQRQEAEAPSIESCYLCARAFTDDSEIFMYRGNAAFCSDDCRQEQIEFDEAKERKIQKKVMSRRKSDLDQSSSGSDVRPGSSVQVA